ncbi:MAG: HD domain-containing protein [Planctomycetes bacterium]|nr:HD domain-containing protein [Planctomycetota bacterium]
MIKFKCLTGRRQGQVFELKGDCVVLGRGKDCAVCLDDEACSRYHARIVEVGGAYIITDLDSTNGVRVNGKPEKEARLTIGDGFVLGRSTFVFLSESGGPEGEDDSPQIENTVTLESVRKLCAQMGSADIEELRRVHGMMQAAYRLGQALSATLDGDDIYTLIAQQIFENFPAAERVCLFLRRKEDVGLELVRNVSRTKGEDAPVSRSLLRSVEAEQVAILASDASCDERFAAAESVVIQGLRSLMLVPMVARNKFVGALYVENSTRPACFKKVDLELLALLGTQAAFAVQNAFLYEDLQVSFYETIRSLSNALEAKDKYTHGHSGRVARYAVGIARELGLDEERLERLRTAAELHDIGKIAIPEAIIAKKGKLTNEEFAAIKRHPQLGVEILRPIRFLTPTLPFILHHHERYNGGGYPSGLKGRDIPLEARIINMADAFDAMTTQRPYNTPMTFQEALERCRKAGGSFDPACVQALGAYLAKGTWAQRVAEAPAAVPAEAQPVGQPGA